ncbi:hypothetical protein SAMN05443245_3395 [Paraburkholderia fungorum]|uniref:Uncharacterized protein n=1 Tax=Paraburkholderia fungorum TaxID=134537 RepID=A0A1H1GZ82_9BURK|nr:hypothetical protein [Paraburkholderia fungorum]SDR18461.1 hypothetical protein SAMN05443245_3395 [Paraburkholderia fungorum]
MKTQSASLAVAATLTAACLSIQAGLQRGGFVAERALWVAVGVVLVVAAHLLPALVRSHGWRIRIVGAVIWLACVAATCYGHAVFFLMAQKHAGDLRAAAVPVVTAKGRGLAEIARDRADAVTRLARTNARRCVEPCPKLIADRTAAAARVDALDIEQAEARRAEAAQDRATAARDAALADPVTGAMTAFGVTAAHADLIAGLAFAAVLEAVACFAWMLTLRPVVVTEIAATPVTQGSHVAPVTAVTVTSNAAPVAEDVTEPAPVLQLPVIEQADDKFQRDVTRARNGIAAGETRATVRDLQQYLGVAQKTASAIRKQIAEAPS